MSYVATLMSYVATLLSYVATLMSYVATLMSCIATLMSYVTTLMSYVDTLMSYVAVAVIEKNCLYLFNYYCLLCLKKSNLSWSEKGFSSTVASISIFCILCCNFITCVH